MDNFNEATFLATWRDLVYRRAFNGHTEVVRQFCEAGDEYWQNLTQRIQGLQDWARFQRTVLRPLALQDANDLPNIRRQYLQNPGSLAQLNVTRLAKSIVSILETLQRIEGAQPNAGIYQGRIFDQRGLMNPRDRFQFNRQQGGLVNQGAAFQPFNQRQLYRGRNRFNEFGGFPQLAQNFQNMRLQEREQRQQAREDRMNRFQGGFRPRLQGFAGRQQGAFPGQFQQQNEEDEDEPGPDHVFPPTQYATQIVKPAPGVEEAATKKSVASKSAAAAKSSLKAPPSSKYESVPFKHPNEKSTVKRPSQASSRTQKVFSATQFNSAWRGRKWSDQQVSDALVEAFEAGPHFWANFERRVGNVSRQLSQEENEEFEELLILRRRWEEDRNVLHSEIFFGRISPAL